MDSPQRNSKLSTPPHPTKRECHHISVGKYGKIYECHHMQEEKRFGKPIIFPKLGVLGSKSSWNLTNGYQQVAIHLKGNTFFNTFLQTIILFIHASFQGVYICFGESTPIYSFLQVEEKLLKANHLPSSSDMSKIPEWFVRQARTSRKQVGRWNGRMTREVVSRCAVVCSPSRIFDKTAS